MNDPKTVLRAREIANSVLNNQLDPLLACRKLIKMGPDLPDVPTALWDTFVGVASEIDGLPVGEERQYWDEEALRSKDKEALRYREQVRGDLNRAFRELVDALA